MNPAKLTIELPASEIVFLEEYAKRHQTTIAELFEQFIKQLRMSENYSFHPDIQKFAGMVPKDIDARREYYEYLEEKHK